MSDKLRRTPSLKNRVVGAVLGSTIGDALGAPTVHLSSAGVRERYGLVGVTGFERWEEKGGARMAPYTDNTVTAEAVIRAMSCMRSNSTVEDYFRDLYRDFCLEGTIAALRKELSAATLRDPSNDVARVPACSPGTPWRELGSKIATDCGSLVRAFPFGLFHANAVDAAVLFGVEQSKLTHSHPSVLAACAAISAGIADIVNAVPTDRVVLTMENVASRFCEMTASRISEAVDDAYASSRPHGVLKKFGTHSAADVVAASVYLFLTFADDFRGGVLAAANSPGPSSALGTLVGALLGARVGIDELPDDWVRDIERSFALRLLGEDLAWRIPEDEIDAPNASGVLVRDELVEAWELWDTCLNLGAGRFHDEFGVWPNALVASSATLRRMSVEADGSGNVVDGAGDAPSEGGVAEFEMFFGDEYALDFLVDEAIAFGDYWLVYDAHPSQSSSHRAKQTSRAASAASKSSSESEAQR